MVSPPPSRRPCCRRRRAAPLLGEWQLLPTHHLHLLPQTPSSDPELWAAIMASIEEQSKQKRCQLSRHLSEAAPEVAGRLRQRRGEQLRCLQHGVTFFEGEAEAGGDSGLVLPSVAGYPPAVRAAVLRQLCSEQLLGEAEQVRPGLASWPGKAA